MRVLVLDDEPAVSQYVETCLRDEGHTVVRVESPEAALVAARSTAPFDLLVVDLNLAAALDGAEVATALREHAPQLAVVMITGAPFHARKRLATTPGSVILSKPFLPADLLAAIDHALLGRHS